MCDGSSERTKSRLLSSWKLVKLPRAQVRGSSLLQVEVEVEVRYHRFDMQIKTTLIFSTHCLVYLGTL